MAQRSVERTEDYGVILVRKDVDRFDHNALFARELSVAFSSRRVPMRIFDYLGQAAEVFAAFRDPRCRFFLCFNGFGSELSAPVGSLRLVSAFSTYQKPLFDLMHDCPAHESMAHQLGATYPERHLFATDYGYAALATSMGFPNVTFIPSIAFPATLGPDVPRASDRSIDVLLPIGLSPPAKTEMRHMDGGSPKSRVYKSIFQAVTELASDDWRLDPIAELQTACRESGVSLDLSSADGRFLLTTVVDFVKFARRRRLLRAIAHLPVTVMTDHDIEESLPASRLQFISPRSATDTLKLMRDAKCVLCPTPHMTGFHERVLGALSAGAAVIAAPNKILQANFIQGRDLIVFPRMTDAASCIERILGHTAWLDAMAHSGREKALTLYPPRRLVDTILSLLGITE